MNRQTPPPLEGGWFIHKAPPPIRYCVRAAQILALLMVLAVGACASTNAGFAGQVEGTYRFQARDEAARSTHRGLLEGTLTLARLDGEWVLQLFLDALGATETEVLTVHGDRVQFVARTSDGLFRVNATKQGAELRGTWALRARRGSFRARPQ